MAESKQHPWVRASEKVATWLDSKPEALASTILGNEPPWTKRMTADEALRYWRGRLFNEEGVPNPAATSRFMQDNGAAMYSTLVTRLKKNGMLNGVETADTAQPPMEPALPEVPEPPADAAPPVPAMMGEMASGY